MLAPARLLVLLLVVVSVACGAAPARTTREAWYRVPRAELEAVTADALDRHYPGYRDGWRVGPLWYDASGAPLPAMARVSPPQDGTRRVTLLARFEGDDGYGYQLHLHPSIVAYRGGEARPVTVGAPERDVWLASLVDPVYRAVHDRLGPAAITPPRPHRVYPAPR